MSERHNQMDRRAASGLWHGRYEAEDFGYLQMSDGEKTYRPEGRPVEGMIASSAGSAMTGDIVKRAFTLHNSGDLLPAQQLYRLALCLEPANFDAAHLLGVVMRPEDPLRAVCSLVRALRMAPGNPNVLQNLRNALQHALIRIEGAYQDGRLRDLHAMAQSLAGLDAVEWVEAAANLGRMLNNAAYTALYNDGDVELAFACVELAAHFNRHPTILSFRMLVRLYRQDYTAAWNHKDWKVIAAQSGQWDGEPHSGTLVLLNRNGMGDFLQFMRFIPLARRRVGGIVVILRSELITLVRNSPMLEGVMLAGSDPGIPGSVYCDTFSLGFALGLGPQDIAMATPYLSPPATLLADWRRALRRDGTLHIAITWSSWAAPDARSVPFDLFKRLIATTDAVFFGVHANFSQKDLREAEVPENFRFFGVSDLSTTACILGAMDVVIAPDGGIAHLACVLGVETWVLATCNCDWRWRGDGEGSAWYANARLFRQPRQGDWETVFDAVAARIQARLVS